MSRSVELPRFLEGALAAGHPWVYRDHVPHDFRADPGAIVKVRAGQFTGYAIWDDSSAIALRVYSTKSPTNAAWVAERVRAAWELREQIRATRTSAYRWIFGEGDGLPGITVDLYAGYAVVASYAGGLDAIVGWVVDALSVTTELRGIVQRDEKELRVLRGRAPTGTLVVEEHGVRLSVDLRAGQKTGLFLDHRENRRFIAEHCAGRRVLNLFSYTGAFSMHAALAGATHVTSVDSAPGAIEAARENLRLNGLDPESHELVVADVFEFVDRARAENRSWDVTISDPPSFARSKQQQKAAVKAYTRLNSAGFRVTEPGGLYAAASCTSQVGPDMFRETLAASAARAKLRFQIIHEAGQPLDHPVMSQHLEGRYLKFVVGRLLDPV